MIELHEEERWARRVLNPFAQRSRRYQLAQWRADHARELGSGSAALCMRASAPEVRVDIAADGAIGKSGVLRCGHSTLCTVCAPSIRSTRAADIEALVEAAVSAGYEAWFVTVTIPHSKTDYLGDVLDQLTAQWREMFGNGTGHRWKANAGYQGMVRSVEVTYGENGFHPHIHAVIIAEWLDPLDVVSMWRARWKSLGILDQWVPNRSIDIRRCTSKLLGRYMAKLSLPWGAGLELARADLKSGKGLSPAQLLELASTDEGDWMARWVELEHSTKGLHWIQWSPKLRAKAAQWQTNISKDGGVINGVSLAVEELTDAEAAEGGVALPVASYAVPCLVWNWYRERGQLGALLSALVNNQGEAIGARRIPVSWPSGPLGESPPTLETLSG